MGVPVELNVPPRNFNRRDCSTQSQNSTLGLLPAKAPLRRNTNVRKIRRAKARRLQNPFKPLPLAASALRAAPNRSHPANRASSSPPPHSPLLHHPSPTPSA